MLRLIHGFTFSLQETYPPATLFESELQTRAVLYLALLRPPLFQDFRRPLRICLSQVSFDKTKAFRAKMMPR